MLQHQHYSFVRIRHRNGERVLKYRNFFFSLLVWKKVERKNAKRAIEFEVEKSAFLERCRARKREIRRHSVRSERETGWGHFNRLFQIFQGYSKWNCNQFDKIKYWLSENRNTSTLCVYRNHAYKLLWTKCKAFAYSYQVFDHSSQMNSKTNVHKTFCFHFFFRCVDYHY